MDYLWTPWRYAYISGADQTKGCIFCEAPKESDSEAHIVYRGTHCYIILNTYPYTNGHLLVSSRAHKAELEQLTSEELIDLRADVGAELLRIGCARSRHETGGDCKGAERRGALHEAAAADVDDDERIVVANSIERRAHAFAPV